MPDERYDQRITTQLTIDQAKELDGWRQTRGLASDASAVRFIVLERLKHDRELADTK